MGAAAGVSAVGGAAAGGGADALISSNGRSFSSHSGLGALGAMATSFLSAAKQSMSTCRFHTPSARSAKEYRPCGSVTATTFLSPMVAVTVAPGTGRPANLTTPWCSEAGNSVQDIPAKAQ